MRTPDPSWMSEIFETAGISLNPDQLGQIWLFHQLLQKHNTHGNLTRIEGFENIVLKHYVDSMLPGKMLSLPEKIIDIGSGPGFPGVPLKILQPHIEFILAEDRPKRSAFLREVCGELNLQKTSIFPHKINADHYHEQVGGVITRALEDISKTLFRCKNFLKMGGVAIFMKGPKVDQELAAMRNNRDLQSCYRLQEDKQYTLPILNHRRRLLVYERTNDV